MPIIRQSIVVNFGAEEEDDDQNNLLILQVDSREAADGGLNNGRTSFFPGESAYILRYASGAVGSLIMRTTEGSLNSAGGGSIDVDEVIEFFETDRINLPLPVSGGLNASWLGTAYSDTDFSVSPGISLVGDTIARTSNGVKVQGLLRVQYTASYDVFRLSSVSADRALVYAKGVVP